MTNRLTLNQRESRTLGKADHRNRPYFPPVQTDRSASNMLNALTKVGTILNDRNRDAAATQAIADQAKGIKSDSQYEIYNKVWEQQEGKASVIDYKKSMNDWFEKEGQHFTDYAEFEAEVKRKQEEFLAGRSKDWMTGMINGGGLDIDDKVAADFDGIQKGRARDTFISGIKKRGELSVLEGMTGEALHDQLMGEQETGKSYYTNRKEASAAMHEIAFNHAMETGDTQFYVDFMSKSDKSGITLKHTELSDAYVKNLRRLKDETIKKRVNNAYLSAKEVARKTDGSYDMGKASEFLDKEIAEGRLDLTEKEQALSSLRSRRAEKIAEDKRLKNEAFTEAYETSAGLMAEGKFDEAMNVPALKNSDRFKLKQYAENVRTRENKEEADLATMQAIRGLMRGHYDNFQEAFEDLPKDAEITATDLAHINSVAKLLGAEEKEYLGQIMTHIEKMLGDDFVKGHSQPALESIMKVQREFIGEYERAKKIDDPIDMKQLLDSVTEKDNWLRKSIISNRPGLMESINSSIEAMGVNNKTLNNPRVSRKRWNMEMNRELGKHGVAVEDLIEFVKGQAGEGFRDSEFQRQMSDSAFRKEVIEDFLINIKGG